MAKGGKVASSSAGREYTLMFALGLSIGVLLATIFTELYGMNFIVGCKYRSSYLHDDMRKASSQERLSVRLTYDDLDDKHHMGGDKVAKGLEKKIRVLCWVMTNPDRLQTSAKAVKETWGRRCNVLLFMSTEENGDLPGVVNLQAHGAVVHNMWSKTRTAWRYVYKKHLHDADWFLKADDSSFVVVENLRYLLARFNASDPEYLGRWFKTSGGYNTESAGYVFSKETLRTFMRAMNNPMKCKSESDLEDSNIGSCLSAFGIRPSDTRDSSGQETFHPFAPEYHVVPNAIKSHHWIHKSNKHPVYSGPGCCSENSISFNGLNHDTLYIVEHLVYHLKPYGFQQIQKQLPKKTK